MNRNWTGNKDKHGVEIYVNDIVLTDVAGWHGRVVVNVDEPEVYGEYVIVDSSGECCTAGNWSKYEVVYSGYTPVLELNILQDEQWEWTKKNFPGQPKYHPLLGVAEEVGELNHAILKMEQGIRGLEEEHLAEAKDAVGDIMIYLAGVCSHYGLNMQECLDTAWKEVKDRDWGKSPNNGKKS